MLCGTTTRANLGSLQPLESAQLTVIFPQHVRQA